MTNRKIIYSEKEMLKLARSDNSLVVNIVDHPLVRESLRFMRDQESDKESFRSAVHQLAPILLYAATTDLSEKKVTIQTPLATIESQELGDKIVLIPVLRSGIGMHDSAENIFPRATTIFAGMARDEATSIPHWYYDLKRLEILGDGEGTTFLVLDPMLATGGSAKETIRRIKDIYPMGRIKMISMIAAPEGVRILNLAYPDVAITVAAVDDHLNDKNYIVPGLGDAGDRQFGTT